MRDVRVIEDGERLALRLEARGHLARVHAELDDLQRDVALDGARLVRAVDDAEAAFAQLFDQLVGPEHGAGALAHFGLGGLRLDTRNETFFVEGDPALRDYRALRETFGSDEVVYLLVETPEGAFAAPHLERLLELGDALRALDAVRALRSPLHSPIPLERGETLEGVSVADEPPQGDAARAAVDRTPHPGRRLR